MEKPPLIAVFDSGVGGLTILRVLRQKCPTASFVYGADQAHFPYGPKSEAEVLRHVIDFISELTKVVTPDVLVVACGTASTIVLPALRAQYSIPIVGVVPAIKPAAQLSQTKVIGLLATPGTVVRSYTDQLIAEHAADCQVIKLGSSLLVELAEAKMRGAVLDRAVIAQEIAPLFAGPGSQIDTVVLGCTHFPLLLEELTANAARMVTWVDSGDAVAARVAFLLQERVKGAASEVGLTGVGVQNGPGRLFFTGPTPLGWQTWGFASAQGLPFK